MFESFRNYSKYGVRGEPPEQEEHSSGNFLGVRPGNERMLPSLRSFRAYANPGAASRLQEDESEHDPGWLESAVRLAVFNSLTKQRSHVSMFNGRPTVVTESRADQIQQKLLGNVQKIIRDPVPLLIPDERNVSLIANRVHMEIDSIPLRKDEIILDPEHFEHDVQRRAMRLTGALYGSEILNVERIRPEERAIAEELWSMRNMTSPRGRRDLLRQRVLERAEDLIAKQRVGAVLEKLPQIRHRHKELTRNPPQAWLINDYLTSELLLTPDEQQRLEGILWGLNAGGLWIRDIRAHRDVITIPFKDIVGGNGDGLLLTVDQPQYYDRVVSPLGRLRPFADRFISPTSVGRIQIESRGRDRLLGQFTVRNAGMAREQILNLARHATTVANTIDTVGKHVLDQDPDTRFLLRPKMIMRALPDKTIMHFDPIDAKTREQNIRDMQREILGIRGEAHMFETNLRREGQWVGGQPINIVDRRKKEMLFERHEAAMSRYGELTQHGFDEDLEAGKLS